MWHMMDMYIWSVRWKVKLLTVSYSKPIKPVSLEISLVCSLGDCLILLSKIMFTLGTSNQYYLEMSVKTVL